MSDDLWSKIQPHLKGLKSLKKPNEYRAFCVYHDDVGTPNLDINPAKGVYFCHACGAKGPLSALAQKIGVLNSQRPTEQNQRPVNTPEEANAELARRGIRPGTRQHFQIATEGKAWVWPVRGGRRFKRWPGHEGSKNWHDEGTPNKLYGLGSLPEGTEFVYYLSGEPDLWIAWQAGLPAVCHIYGEGKGKVPEDAVDELKAKGIAEVRVIADLDETGQGQERAIIEAMQDTGLAVKVLDLPDFLGEKGDLNDLYLWLNKDDGALRQAVEELPVKEIGSLPELPILSLLGTIPDLPKAARLTPDQEAQAQEASMWLNEYTAYVSAISPQTPLLFHEAGGLWLAGLAIARRLVLCMAHDIIYPNLFVLWIAVTTLYAKSTGLKEVRNILNEIMAHLRLPSELTPEALMAEMSGREPPGLDNLPEIDRQLWQKGRNFAAQRGILLDEANSLFMGLKRDYNIGLGELLMRLYDCADKHTKSTRGGGYFVVRDACLSFLGATTPGGLKKADVNSLWETGLWPRFALLTPNGSPDPARSQDRARPAIIEDRLMCLLNNLHRPTYPDTPGVMSVALEKEVFNAWECYDKAVRFDLLTSSTPPDDRLWGVYGRLPNQALKVAIILAALDWPGGPPPVIELKHWYKAQMIAESWRLSAHRLLEQLDKPRESDKDRRIFTILQEAGAGGITARDLSRRTGIHYQDVKKILEALTKEGEVEQFKYKPPKQGRPGVRYRL